MPEPVIETLRDLVRINSVNPHYAGGVPEQALAEYVEHFFQQRGIATWRQEVYPGRPNILARLPGRPGGGRIVFEAHLDTVSVAGMPGDPWSGEIRDGKLYGRGACDTKGGMAAMMHAMLELAAKPAGRAREVLFAATIDEEYAYRGVVALCDSLAPGVVDPECLSSSRPPRHPWTADAAIVAEPTQLRAVIASKGVLRWKIETQGVAAHSSKPHLGINAIEHMAHVIAALQHETRRLAQKVHPLLGPATCNVGVIRGGVQVNFVPDRCEIEVDRRLLPGETPSAVWQAYHRLMEQLMADHPSMQVHMLPPMLTDWPLETQADAPAVVALSRVLAEYGLDAQPTGVPYGSDASKFSQLGIPSMILGPGSIDQAHAAEEYIECAQVEQATEIYRRFVDAFA